MPGIYNYDDILVQSGDHKNVEENIYFADPAILDIFIFPFQPENPGFSYNKYSILLTSKMASKYFGEQPALGTTLQVEGLGDLTIAG